ncbi:MAG TPA: LysE family translocator [Candidatus Limnocylindrales bacterium]|nr:LysE family translocator [Candidatus Limnocylindrales bacterium]
MPWLVGLIGFSLVSAGTPGPNNVLLWASGATFGFRRTLPHVLGTALGIGAMTLAVAAGVGLLVTSIPGLTVLMKLVGSAYLLLLAYRIAKGSSTDGTTVARPMSIVEASAFQTLNPKGWIFAFGAVTTFRPDEFAAIAGSLAVAGTMMVVILPCAAAWALAGGAMARLMSGEQAGRAVSLILGGLVAVSVVAVWL